MKKNKQFMHTVAAMSGGLLALSAQANFELEEVIVTATKRAESQQDVPLAVTAFDSSAMERRGITETSEMTGMVPSLVVSSPFGRTQPNFALRGVSVANEFNPNAASPIGFYVNEDYKQFRPTHGMQLFDLERVEVIRGPQGTLFGRNTTGGAISVHTVKPQLGEVGEFSGYVKGKYGNYNRWSVEAATETTLIQDKLAVRLAVTENQGDGYIENKTPKTIQSIPELLLGAPGTKQVDALTSEDFASVDDRAFRATAVWTPTDTVEVTFVVTHGEANPIGAASITNEFGPVNATGEYANIFGYNREMFGATDEDEAVADQTGHYSSSADDYGLTVNWDLSDNLTLTSITGYQEGDMGVPRDCDGLPIKACFVDFNSEFDQFNQDIRLSWDFDRTRIIVGAYYGEDEVKTLNDETFFGPQADLAGISTATFAALGASNPLAQQLADALTDAGLSAYPSFNPPVDSYIAPAPLGLGAFVGNPALLASGFRAVSQFTQSRESKAIYFEGSHDVTESLTLTLGLRYTEDDFELSGLRSTFYDLTTGLAQYNAIPLNASPDQNQTLAPLTGASDEYTGRFIVDYKATDSIMAFASYSRGYRAGTFNGKASQSVSQVTFVEPEFVDNYEIGVKSRLFDDRIQLNATLFLAEYEDQQVQEVVGATSFLRNASGVMQGLEVEMEAIVTDTFLLGVNLGLLDTEYDDGVIVNGLDLGGNEFPFAPSTTVSVFSNWEIMELGDGTLELSSVVRYQDDIWFDPFNDQKTSQNGPGKSSQMQEAYTLVDLRLSYMATDFEVSFWSKNVTDKTYYVSGFDTSSFLSDDLIRGEPRTFGVEAKYHF
ncbi:TonB-dependent receptor [Aestuariicella hydrocarbonica]|uniref:TonB-dependent receptor n=1 Tax=Pseudomaricurvus hydrocarbonicus TaxID=1470433 RepID=A0A9E5JUG2_9GAMM|nr:TonB-dependent receptor [Aestuariicella hydrocarbonica]NHO64766.1 TonB-dependent receptor [Aestuariicella hydrocarbonica]